MASVILQGSPATLAVGGGDVSGGVASVAAGTYMSNSGSPSAVVLNSTLVAGDGIEISAGVLNSVSVNLAAGAGITITPPATAGDPITIAASTASVGFTQYSSVTSSIGASPYPTQLSATAFGSGFIPTTTGFYVVQFTYQPSTVPSVWGAGDILQVGLVSNGASTVNYVNWFGPSDPSALQTIESQTLLVQLSAGTTYTFEWWALNTSTTLNLAGGFVKAVIYA